MEKTCFKCHSVKPLTEFYRHPMMGDGHLGKCKECTKRDATNHRNANIDRYRAYDRVRYTQPDRRESTNRHAKLYVASHPKARAAHMAVHYALRSGRIARCPCEVCGTTTRVHAHHDDYDKPLDVRWLCVPHHADWHQKNGPGKNIDQPQNDEEQQAS